MRFPSRYRLRLATTLEIIQSRFNDTNLQLKTYEPLNLATVQNQTKSHHQTKVNQSDPEVCFLPSPFGPAPLCAQGCEGLLISDPSYRPWNDTLSQASGELLLSSGNVGECGSTRFPKQP